MRRVSASAYVGLVVALSLVAASINAGQALHAQTQTAPAAGTSMMVRMMDAVNSANDPSGTQYRASVTKAVDAGNRMIIPQDALAAVRLVSRGNGSGSTTQLVSVTINGQPVAIASSSASVTSGAQNSAGIAVNAMNSALAGLGHHVNAPAGVSAVVTGQRVMLPTGTALNFVLRQPSAPSPAVSAAQPMSASVAPAPSLAFNPAATSGAGGPLTAMEICFSNPPPSGPNHNTEYLTAAFEVPIDALRASQGLESAFADYLKATYHVKLQVTCQPIWSITDARTAQKKIAGDRDSAKLNMVNTGWRYEQPPLAQGQSGFDPLALGPGGLDLSQHRLTTYFCSLIARGGTTMAQTDPALANQVNYVSPVFEADWDSAPVDRAFDVYIRDHYVHDLSLSDTSSRCGAQSPEMQPMMHQRAMISSADNGHVVPVDFTDTPAQAAAGNAAATQMAAAAATAPRLGPREYYVFCTSDPSAPVIYFSEVFVGTADPPRGGMRGVSFRNIGNNFPVFLQQKYSFKSSASCLGGASESAQAQGLKQQLEDQYKKANKQIVETGWKNQ